MKLTPLRLVFILAVLLSTDAFGEFYKYTDEDGTVHYTDDLSAVPENKRPNVAALQSNETQPVVTGENGAKKEALSKSAGIGERQKVKAELDRIKEKLRRTYQELIEKRKTLGNPPPEDAKSGEKAEHIRLSRELNRQIKEYNQLSDEFEQKVNEYNDKYNSEA